ncbi:MAG: SPOR domain-containing protein [Bacteroidales bacterium]|nr:SPOR domain-containing protein [Bacteroidales bacterium]
MKAIGLIFIICNLSLLSYSQDVTKNDIFNSLEKSAVSGAKITITQDYAVKSLVRKHVESNIKLPPKGYRIVIFSGSGAQSESKANQVRTQFKARFYKTEAYTKYHEPNFRVHVGDFRNKSEALKVYKEVKKYYSSAYIIEDRIEFPDL